MNAVKVYGKYFSIHLRSALQYKSTFLILTFGQALASFGAFLSVYFLFNRFGNVEGYTFSETLICYAAVLLSYSLVECFMRGLDQFETYIKKGEFDQIMIRPRNEIFLVICGRIELARLGRMVQALVVFCYAIPTCGVEWTALRVLTLVIMCVSGVAVFSGLFILHAALCFFTIDGIELMNILINGGMTMSAYPLDIYGRGILWFATFVVPFACIQYYPFLYIIGRTDSLVNVFLPLIGILFIIPCYLFWKFGVRHYKSVGS